MRDSLDVYGGHLAQPPRSGEKDLFVHCMCLLMDQLGKSRAEKHAQVGVSP